MYLRQGPCSRSLISLAALFVLTRRRVPLMVLGPPRMRREAATVHVSLDTASIGSAPVKVYTHLPPWCTHVTVGVA